MPTLLGAPTVAPTERTHVELPVGERATRVPAAPATVAALLFASGLCALIYQIAWLREMRLVFGASTAASAAVLAVFMGGLGLGGLALGRRADAAPNPLALYARLELAIAAVAFTTPGLAWIARAGYVAVGGASTLGLAGATVARLFLTALVLAAPTILMGGTLPAAGRAVETAGDAGRRRLALVYGANTLGAVTGALLATFCLLEIFGTRTTIWIACLVNGLVAVVARHFARELVVDDTRPEEAAAPADDAQAPPVFVLGAAFSVGLAFFLMELVWYRMLAPLLGGSSFTFGLVLAVALLGVGVGGIGYALRRADRPATLHAFGFTCLLEAVLVGIPYALGDRIAHLALFLRPLAGFGFSGLVLGWAVVAGAVVLPASIVAGYQFPMLIALLGRGGKGVGRHVGLACAWNTVGAIVGSLAGGFGVLPLLSATGTWAAVVVLTAILGVAATAVAVRVSGDRRSLVVRGALAAFAGALVCTSGPTAAWRHGGIGAGRSDLRTATPAALHDWANETRRTTTWAADGVESSVAINSTNSDAFIVNGKSDGSARGDAGTQVMFSLVPAILHGAPRRALVVGLGTGSSAGWLAAIPSMERVDVVELEPAIAEVARRASPVNRDVLANPKVHLVIGDAREVVLTSTERYDLVVSEPSNPYRAGVASLFTREFYEAVARQLAPGGLFAQWLQAYEVDARTIATVYATLGAVFPEVQTWQTLPTDVVLVAAAGPIALDATEIGRRIAAEPYRAALSVAWRADDLEGFLARFVATPAFARRIGTSEEAEINTDDRTPIEFGFARSAGRVDLFDLGELRQAAGAWGEDRPALAGRPVDWATVEERRAAELVELGVAPAVRPDDPPERRLRYAALQAWSVGRLDDARVAWTRQPRQPESSMERLVVGEALAEAGDERALVHAESLRATHPIEADVVVARLRWRQQRPAEAAAILADAFRRYRTDPWPALPLMQRAVQVAERIAADFRPAAADLFAALAEPFAVHAVDEVRRRALVHLLPSVDFTARCREAFAAFEPFVPWERSFLTARLRCYAATRDDRTARAERDLERFFAEEPERLGDVVPPPS